jgi:hypothetical protein
MLGEGFGDGHLVLDDQHARCHNTMLAALRCSPG